MKNTSIRKRLTIYYTCVLLIMAVILCVFIFISAGTQVRSVAKDNLINAVQNGFDEITYENSVIEIDDRFDAYYRGAALIVYSDQGVRLKGSIPSNFPVETPLKSGDFQNLESGDERWLVYDLFNTYENGNGIWVRGIYTMDAGVDSINAVFLIMLIFFPLFAVISLVVGHFMSQKAFEPVTKITEAANSINNGHDLSMRLPMGENKDELYYLAETLNAMIDRLETAFRSEKEFTSDVSHELKTPIAVMLAQCEYSLSAAKTEEEYKEAIQVIQTQCRKMQSMIQQLLQVSRTINTDNTIEKEEFDISIMCESVCDEMKSLAAEKGVKLQWSVQKDVKYYGDETLIMRMIMNLLSNGIKYKKEVNQAFVRLALEKAGERVQIKVSDNGIGISEDEQKKVFNRFYKVDKSRNSSQWEEQKDMSFGLGLSMVKWIAEAHGGNVTVKSILGEGSEFVVEL